MLSEVSSPNACNLLHLSNSQQVPTIFCAKKSDQYSRWEQSAHHMAPQTLIFRVFPDSSKVNCGNNLF